MEDNRFVVGLGAGDAGFNQAMNIKTAPLWQWILLLIASLIQGFLGYGL